MENEKAKVLTSPYNEKQLTEVSENHTQDINNTDNEELSDDLRIHGGDTALANASWKYKSIALITALLFPFGSHFSGSALSAMKKQITTNLQISNTRYGVISASVAIINTLFPIAGGIFIDIFGSVWGTLAINFMVILGSLLTAIAAKLKSYPLMVVARVIFGIGSGLIVTMQESLLSKWFRTQHLSIAIGLQLSISRLSTFLGTLVSNAVAEATGDWVWAFWLSFIICGFSILMNLIYALVVKHLKGQVTLSEKEKELLKKKKTFKWRSIFKFPLIFWHIIFIEFIYAAVWSSFQTIATDLIIKHFKTDNVLAGYKASASQAVPIVATPILGFIMDFYGCRVIILLISSIFLLLSSGLLGWTYVDAMVGMVFYSISLAFGPIAMITSIGMLLPSEYIGTGLGIYKSSNNIGTAILDVVVGVVQDNTNGGAYTNVMLVFIILAGVGFIAISGLWIYQFYSYNNLLEVSRTTRVIRMQAINDRELELTTKGKDPYSETPIKKSSIVMVSIFVAALIVAWVLFFVYSIRGAA
ncbi:major facilitator superfamily domain-containing protein [Cokeromyces recurvatus]|uniref:major facilitator superfamily domain-containing protein n=1 Tax=Cokeromyces recurvatus TaxID=90255 RepID=UPI00221F9481|nr:major facilitator superfamily domain-containing protein [Cokeromyces recurvatus]KAI7902817.1 major facilitator superfamily domain-containing protein [Cokeromyces recurvatus]